MVGVTVQIENEAGGDPQTTFTDQDGGYKITELIPGTYSVSFIDVTATVKKTGIRVGANDDVPVFQAIKRGDVIIVEGKAPQLKLSKTDLSLKIDKDFLTHMPLPGRTVEAAAGTKAGAHNDGIGIAFSGSTSLENRFLVDGIDITGLTFGNVGTPVLNDFVEEIEVLSGGYNAEWGRAIGGIVNIVTKTGTNTFKGGLFATYAPGFLAASREATPSNSS